MHADPQSLATAAAALAAARRIVVVTGAGVSAESRIPTFRDAMTGLWASFDPQKLATPEAFEADPAMVSEWYDWRRLKCAEAIPNPGHEALVRLERLAAVRGASFLLVTQNVDGLHRRAGSASIIEIHGSLFTWRCTKTGAEFTDLPSPLPSYPCPSPAGGLLRPGVVWFGEALPEAGLRRAVEASSEADVFLSVGTMPRSTPWQGSRWWPNRPGRASSRSIPSRPPSPRTPRCICRGRAPESFRRCSTRPRGMPRREPAERSHRRLGTDPT